MTIKLKKYSDVIEEFTATVAITPGMLIENHADDSCRPHATADGDVIPMFALEDELQGKGIDDAYAIGAQVQCWIPYRGDIANAILADGETAAYGDFLISNGDGYLKVYEAESSGELGSTRQIVGQAVEALDLSGSSGEESSGFKGNARIRVRIA